MYFFAAPFDRVDAARLNILVRTGLFDVVHTPHPRMRIIGGVTPTPVALFASLCDTGADRCRQGLEPPPEMASSHAQIVTLIASQSPLLP